VTRVAVLLDVFFGLIPAFFGQRFTTNLSKGDTNEAYQPNRGTVFWWFEAVFEATWRLLMFSSTELSDLELLQQCNLLLTWTVCPQLSWEWNPQAPPLFYRARWAWDPWGPLQTPWEILWPLLYQPITIPYCDHSLFFQKQFLTFYWNQTRLVGAVSIYIYGFVVSSVIISINLIFLFHLQNSTHNKSKTHPNASQNYTYYVT